MKCRRYNNYYFDEVFIAISNFFDVVFISISDYFDVVFIGILKEGMGEAINKEEYRDSKNWFGNEQVENIKKYEYINM